MNLGKRTYSSVRWATISSVARILIQTIQLLVLARLLSPEDFGTMAVVTSLFAIVNLFPDFGIGRAVIHYRDLSQRQLSSLYWINIIFSLAFCSILIISSQLLGALYSNSELPQLIIIASFLFPITAIGFLHRILAEKNLQFRVLALIEIFAAIAGISAAIGTAVLGGGASAFATGLIAQALGLSLASVLLLNSKWKPTLSFSFRESVHLVKFGSYAVADALLNTLRHQADILIAALFVGPAALGYYSFARDICLKVGPVIGQILNRVSLPAMSIARDDRHKLERMYLQVLRANCSINFPLYVFMAVFSTELLALFFGETWSKSSELLSIMAIYGIFRATGHPLGNLIYSTGEVRLGLIWNLSLAVIIPAILLVATAAGGMNGLAWALAFSYLALIYPSWLFLMKPLCKTDLNDYIEQIWLPLIISVLSVLPIRWLSTNIAGELHIIVIAGVSTVPVYILLSRFFNRPFYQNILTLVK